MLGEGFITMLPYREQSKDSAPASPQSRSPLCRNPNQKTKLGSISLKVIKEMEEVPGLEQGLEQIRPPQPSPSVLMPSDPADRLMSLELYQSWHCHCTSFCKDYPDLQLRGDHMVDRDSERLSPQYVLCGGPLHSQDLGDPEPPQPPQPPQPGPAPLGLQAVSDDGYLEMDSSITLDKREPLSNSMLNCYLESKLLEVYRQHLQDSLARSGFPVNPALLPSVVLPSVDQLSRQLSMEQGLEVSVARNVVTNYLSSICTCTGATSSHFSSPVLRISKPL